jgi:hypothetical protein
MLSSLVFLSSFIPCYVQGLIHPAIQGYECYHTLRRMKLPLGSLPINSGRHFYALSHVHWPFWNYHFMTDILEFGN